MLTANPGVNNKFVKWEGSANGSNNPISIAMNSNKSITAIFQPIPEDISTPKCPAGPSSGKINQNLTFTTGDALSNYGHGVEYQFSWGDGSSSSWDLNAQTHSYVNAGSFTIRAQARCKTHPNIVSNWSSGKNISLSGYQMLITIDPANAGFLTKNPDKSQYNHNEPVTLTANPASLYKFKKWGGALNGTNSPCAITMNGDKNVIVYFEPIKEEVTTPNKPSGNSTGTVNQNLNYSTNGSTSNFGHTVEYQFDWGDGNKSDWNSSSQYHSFSIMGTYSIKARARCKTHLEIVSTWSTAKIVTIAGFNLTFSINPEGTGNLIKRPNKNQYNLNEAVELTAQPAATYLFDKWGSDLCGSSNPISILMNNHKYVTAYFEQIPEEISTPDKPTGPSDGKVDQILGFKSGGAKSNLNHAVEYRFDWGDNSRSSWGEKNRNYSFPAPGLFQIRVQAHCQNHQDIVSEWSDGFSINITPNFYSISGKAYYYSGGSAIPDVLMNISGEQDTIVFTDLDGCFAAALRCDNNYSIFPSKEKGEEVGPLDVTLYDAVLTARHAMNVELLDSLQQIAADVDKDGMICLYDAVLIAQYAITASVPIDASTVGEWNFVPTARYYKNLATNFTNQDYVGIILGNVHGNWLPLNNLRKKELINLPYLGSSKIYFVNKNLIMPLVIDSALEVLSADIELSFDPEALNFVEVKKTNSSQNFQLLVTNEQGYLRIGLFSTAPIHQNGNLIDIVFSLASSCQNRTALRLKHFIINNEINFQKKEEIFVQSNLASITHFRLSQNYPNPFNNSTCVDIELPEPGEISISIFNMNGQLIINLIKDRFETGRYTFQWDGEDNVHSSVNSGLYFLKLQYCSALGEKQNHVRRIILLK